MPNYNIKICNSKRDDVIEYILRKRQEGKFTVVDVGGSIYGRLVCSFC